MVSKQYLDAVKAKGIFTKSMKLDEFLQYALILVEPIVNNRNNKYKIWHGKQININSIEKIKNVAREVGVEYFEIDNKKKIPVEEINKSFCNGFPDGIYNPLYKFYRLQIFPRVIEDVLYYNAENNLTKEKFTLVLGAGISVSLGIPSWYDLLDHLANRFLQKVIDEAYRHVEKKVGNRPKLAIHKDNQLRENRQIQYARVIRESQRFKLYNNDEKSFYAEIADIIGENYRKCDSNMYDNSSMKAIIEFIKENINKIDSIITYNYDDILETKLLDSGIKTVACYADKNNEEKTFSYGEADTNTKVLNVYHVHGYINLEKLKDKYVDEIKDIIDCDLILSEEDYHKVYDDESLFTNKIQLEKYKNTSCIFLGVSLTDPNMRRLLDKSVNQTDRSSKHYWITKSNLGNIYHSIYSDIKKIYENLTETRNECRNYIHNNKYNASYIKGIINKAFKQMASCYC